MKEVKFCPGTLAEGYDTYCHTAIKRVFGGRKVSHILDFSNDEEQQGRIVENIGQLSISGVQEKLSAVIDRGTIRLTQDGEQGRYIIKPVPEYKNLMHRKQIPANEHLTMQIARQVYQIKTAENALIFFSDGEPAYITNRFDIADDGTKMQQEDFASLLQMTSETHGKHFKYTGCYADVAAIINKYVAARQVETIKFFRLVVFNYLFGNGDAHWKNFSLQQSVNGDYLLAPAYDLMNSSLHINDGDFALEGGLFGKEHYTEVYQQKGHPCKEDFITFGKLINVPEIQIHKVMQQFLEESTLVYELTNRSFLNETLKRMYVSCYKERLARLRR